MGLLRSIGVRRMNEWVEDLRAAWIETTDAIIGEISE